MSTLMDDSPASAGCNNWPTNYVPAVYWRAQIPIASSVTIRRNDMLGGRAFASTTVNVRFYLPSPPLAGGIRLF